jgi:nucleotide-binding universal stress UspA family protein
MSTVRHPVVVGVDGSPSSLNALSWAVDEARMRKQDLRILCAYGWPMTDFPLPPQLLLAHDSNRAAAEQVVNEAVERARTMAPNLAVEAEVSQMLPAPALIDASDDAAVVVVGNRGRGGFAELLVGSVGTQVAVHAHSPVVVVRSTGAAAGPVVVGVDGSPASVAAVEYAYQQAAWRGAGLVAVHAWRWPTSAEPGDILPLVYDENIVEMEEIGVLAEAVAGCAEKYPDVAVQQRVVRGRPGPMLAIESRSAQLIVVGSRGHGTLTGLMLGSVSHHVLHHAACPVAIVRAR